MQADECHSGVVEEATGRDEASTTEQEEAGEPAEHHSPSNQPDEGELPEEGEITDEEEEGTAVGAAGRGGATSPSSSVKGPGVGGLVGRSHPPHYRGPQQPYLNSNRGGRAFGTGGPPHFQHRPPPHSSSFASRNNSQSYAFNGRGGGEAYGERQQQPNMRRFGGGLGSNVPSVSGQGSPVLNNSSWRSPSSGGEDPARQNLSSAASGADDSLNASSLVGGDKDFRTGSGDEQQDSDHRIGAAHAALSEDNDFRSTQSHFFDKRRRHDDESVGGDGGGNGGDAQRSFKRPRPSHFDGGNERGENPPGRFYQSPQHGDVGGGPGGGGGGRFRPHWAQRTICKFWREGFCRDGDQCTYSHNATDSHRRAELCKFYQHGYCKKGLACQHLHGEYPCKAFHKGECSKEQCQYSHQPLDTFTRPIFEQMLRDEELASQVSMPAQPMRRRVLLPQGPSEHLPPPIDQSSNASSTTQSYHASDIPSGVGGIPPPSVVVPNLTITSAGPPPATFGFFNPVVAPGAPHSVQQMPPPVSMSVPPPTLIGMGPQTSMAFGGIGLNLTQAPPPPPMPPLAGTSSGGPLTAQRTVVSPPKPSEQSIFSSSLLAPKDDEEETGDDGQKGSSSGDGGGGFSILQVIREITERGAAAGRQQKEEINESPASPPPACSLARIEKKMKVIPVATTWRLVEVDVDPDEQLAPMDTAFDSLNLAQKISSSGLTDPRLERLAQRQFDQVTREVEQQSASSSKKSISGAAKTPVDPRKKAHEQHQNAPSEEQLVERQIQMANQQQQQQLDVDHRELATTGISFPPPSTVTTTTAQQIFIGGGLGIQVPPPNIMAQPPQHPPPPFSPQFPPPTIPPQGLPAFTTPPPNILQQQQAAPNLQQMPPTFMSRGGPPAIQPFQQPPPSQPPMQILPVNHGSAGFDSGAVTAGAHFGNNAFGNRGSAAAGFDHRADASSGSRSFRQAPMGRNDDERAGRGHHHRDHGGSSTQRGGGSRHYSARYHNNRAGGERWENRGAGGGGSPSWRSRRSGGGDPVVGDEARNRNRNNNFGAEGEESTRRSYSPRNNGDDRQHGDENAGAAQPSPGQPPLQQQQPSPSDSSREGVAGIAQLTTPTTGGETKVSMREKRRNNEYESPLAQV